MNPWALIADSDPQRALAHRHLLEAAGLAVFVARDGEQARQVLQDEGVPGVTLTDLSLARVDGFHLIQAIRAEALAESAPGTNGRAHAAAAAGGVSEPSEASKDSQYSEATRAAEPALASAAAQADAPPGAPGEAERLRAVEGYAPQDGQPAPAELQQIVERVTRRFGVSASFISIIMKDRQ